MQVNSVSVNNNSGQNFGQVIKTRFFVIQPNKTKSQIQNRETIEFLSKRLCFHLSHPEKAEKGKIERISKEFGEIDTHYKKLPLVRRVMNFKKAYDNSFYLITAWDAESINCVAHTFNKENKKANIMKRHWDAVKDHSRRIMNEDGDELSLNIYLNYRPNSKTGEYTYYFDSLNVIEEKKMQFPYRGRNENLP